MTSSNAKLQLQLGSTVNVPNNRKGILKFIGQVGDKPGLFAGMELINGDVGRNNGDYKGKYYFHVDVPNTGIFYTYDTIVLCNNTANSQDIKRSSTGTVSHAANSHNTAKALKAKRLSLDSQVRVKQTPRRAFSTSLSSSAEKPERSSLTGGASPRTPDLIKQIADLTNQQNTLLREKSALSSQLITYKAQLDEKVSLLKEYKAAVDLELKPSLEDYKYQLHQKEIKLAKIKQQADQQRDELREAISALEDQASENAEIYTNEVNALNNKIDEHQQIIASLNEKIEELGSKSGLRDETSKIDETSQLRMEIEEKNKAILGLKNQVEERELIISSLNRREDNGSSFEFETSEVSREKPAEISERELELLRNDFAKIQARTEQLTAEIIEKDETIQKLSDNITLLKNEKDLEISIASKKNEVERLRSVDNETLNTNQEQLDLLKSEYEGQIDSKNSEIEKLTAMLNDLTLQKQKESQTRSDPVDKKIEMDESTELAQLKQQLEKRDKEIAQLKNNSYDLQKLNSEISELKDRNLVLLEKNVKLDSLRNHSCGQETDELAKDLSHEDKEIEELKHNIQVIENLNRQIESLKADNGLLSNREEDLLQQYDDLRYRHSQIEAIIIQKDEEINSLKQDLGTTKLNSEILKQENSQLQAENQLIEDLHKEEMAEKDKKIEDLNKKIKYLENELYNKTPQANHGKPVFGGHSSKTNTKQNNSVSSFDSSSVFSPTASKRLSNNSSIDDFQENTDDNDVNKSDNKGKLRYSSTPEVIQGELPIYKPPTTIDASAGRAKWCGLCEREGHDSYECPFENDVF